MHALVKSPSPVRLGLLAVILALAGGLAAVGGCSSSSSGGAARGDGGDDGSSGSGSGYGPQPEDGSVEGGDGGGDAGEASVCNIPDGAVWMTQTQAGVVGCTATVGNGFCDGQYRLTCEAPNPYAGVPVPPLSLNCGSLQPSSDPTIAHYCCPCQ